MGLVSLLSMGAQARSFEPIGYKASSMGGAGVASSKNAMAAYYNPALLAKADNDVEIALGVGVGIVDNGAFESVNSLNDSRFFDLVDKYSAVSSIGSIDPNDLSVLQNGRDIVVGMNGEGSLITPDAYLSVQIDSFSVGIIGSAETAAIAVIDPAHNRLIFDNTANVPGQYVDIENASLVLQAEYEATSLEYAINSVGADGEPDLTYLAVDSLAVAELPLSYGHAFDVGFADLSVGGSFKFMQGISHTGRVGLSTEAGDITDKLTSSEKKSNDFGIDLGLLLEPSFAEGLRIGMVGKNLNTPSFERNIGADIELDPMLRVGIAYDIFESLEVAVDYDISENDTLLASSTGTYKTQYLGGGVNWHPVTWASIRAGLMENQASSYEGLIYTAGFAVGPEAFQLDLSAQVSAEDNEVDGESYPRAARVNIALISRW